MHNQDPNDMDALFREGAEKHEFIYNPEAWALMEEKLDEKDRRKYVLWFFLGVFLLASILSVYILSMDGDQIENTASVSVSTITKKEIPLKPIFEKEINITANKDNQELDLPKSKPSTSDDNQNQIDNNTVQNNGPELEEEYINTVSKVRSGYIGTQNSIQSENTGSLVDNEVVSIYPPLASTNSSLKDISENNSIGNVNDNLVLKGGEKLRSKILLDLLGTKSVDFIETISQNEERFELQMIRPQATVITESKSRYVFTAFGSTDFSSVGFFPDPQSGFTLGGKVGLQLARKFQLDLGFAYSLKRYGAEGIDYNIEGGWNTMVGINPTRMEGKGNILQIPIETTYYFSGYEKNSFFVNAGVSSFLLNSEWYGFEYNPDDLLVNPGVPLLEEITMDDIPRRNFHLAGVARISVGYQKVLSPYMAFEIAPYLQIPLTGIGEGKVDLYTAGIQFAVKFNTK